MWPRDHRFGFRHSKAPARYRLRALYGLQTLFWLPAILLLLATAGCQSRAPAVDPTQPWLATPPAFVVESERGADLFLLGTIHVGPTPGWTFPDPIERRVRDARTIVMELDLRDATEESISQAIMRHGILPAKTPLSQVISPKTARLLETHEELLEASGLPAQTIEAMQPWLIMNLLVETMLAEADFSPAASVEEKLLAQLGDRELIGLETVDEQLSFLDDLPLDLQEVLLQETLLNVDTASVDLETLIQAWRDDDRAELLRFSRDGADEFPQLHAFYDVILDDRNRHWMATLVELLEDPARQGTTVLVAVGALHLVGPVGLPNLLVEAGYRVDAPDRAPDPSRAPQTAESESHE